MDNVERVYQHIKSYMKEKGFTPTKEQIAEALKLMEQEVEEALEELEKSGKLMIEKAKHKIVKVLES